MLSFKPLNPSKSDTPKSHSSSLRPKAQWHEFNDTFASGKALAAGIACVLLQIIGG